MSKNPLIKSYSSKIGDRNGTKRIWIESKKLHETQLAEHLRYEPFYDFENRTFGSLTEVIIYDNFRIHEHDL